MSWIFGQWIELETPYEIKSLANQAQTATN